jgi:hypothetical protein
LTSIQGSLSNLSIPQSAPSEWISFANTATGESVLLRSQDGTTWTTSQSPFLGGQFNSLVWNGNYWLAVGTDIVNNYTSAKSADGLIWTTSLGPFTTGLANAIAWNGSLWVAMGLDTNSVNTLSVSSDGLSWTIYPGPFTGSRGLAVAWSGDLWLAVGFDQIATSTDGINWTPSIGPDLTNTSGYAGVAWGSGLWIIVGSAVAYSTDASTWTVIPGPFAGGYGTSVTYLNSRFIATGTDGTGNYTIAISFNGFIWTRNSGALAGGYALAVAYNGSRYMVSGFGGDGTVLAISDDAMTWLSLGNTFNTKTFLFTTAIGYANYPEKYGMNVNTLAYISSLVTTSFSGTLNDAQTIIVVDV